MDIVDTIFDNLDRWRNLPSYQLERRADIFFSIYLREVISKRLGKPIHEIIIPEFPIKKGSSNNQSFKVDYLVFAKDLSQAIIIELKTDNRSRDKKEDAHLKEASEKEMPTIINDMLNIFRYSACTGKYIHLIQELELVGLISIPSDFKSIIKRKKSLVGIHECATRIKITAEAKAINNLSLLYIQPTAKQDNDNEIGFVEFREFVLTHSDDFSQRFAKSLVTWANDKAGTL